MPLEDNYNNENFRPDDAIVISQDDLYRLAWEAETISSPLGCPTIYHDPVATETTNSPNAITQQNNNDSSSQKHSDASYLVNDEPHY